MLMKILVIVAMLCFADLIALFVYALIDIPKHLTQGICYPFFKGMCMKVGIIMRMLEYFFTLIGTVFFMQLPCDWQLCLGIGCGVFCVVYTIVFCKTEISF